MTTLSALANWDTLGRHTPDHEGVQERSRCGTIARDSSQGRRHRAACVLATSHLTAMTYSRLHVSGLLLSDVRLTPPVVRDSLLSAEVILIESNLLGISRRYPKQKKAKNRVHLDLVDPALSVEQLVALGASVVAEHAIAGGEYRWTVMQDPEGNEFCEATKSFAG